MGPQGCQVDHKLWKRTKVHVRRKSFEGTTLRIMAYNFFSFHSLVDGVERMSLNPRAQTYVWDSGLSETYNRLQAAISPETNYIRLAGKTDQTRPKNSRGQPYLSWRIKKDLIYKSQPCGESWARSNRSDMPGPTTHEESWNEPLYPITLLRCMYR